MENGENKKKFDPKALFDTEKMKKSGTLGQAAKWLVILVLFLVITNPSIIPFLPEETKQSIRGTWEKLFGDVGKISKSVTINWATLFQVIAIILVMIVVTAVLAFVLSKLKPKSSKGKSIVSLLKSALYYITVLFGFFWCLSAMGVNVSTIFASVGILALIIGFGAQSLVEDLVTGIFLVFEDQFNVGDIIEVGGFRGTVESIGIRTTAIRDVGNNVKVINNSDLRNILNRSTADSFAVTTVSISYSQDLEAAERVIIILFYLCQERLFVLLPFFFRKIVEVIREFLGELRQFGNLLVLVQFFIIRNLQLRESRRVVKTYKGHDDHRHEEDEYQQVKSILKVLDTCKFEDLLSYRNDVSRQEYEQDTQKDGRDEYEVSFHDSIV